MFGHCKDCKYWKDGVPRASGIPDGKKLCFHGRVGVGVTPGLRLDALMDTIQIGNVKATSWDVITGPDFGCVHWEDAARP